MWCSLRSVGPSYSAGIGVDILTLLSIKEDGDVSIEHYGCSRRIVRRRVNPAVLPSCASLSSPRNVDDAGKKYLALEKGVVVDPFTLRGLERCAVTRVGSLGGSERVGSEQAAYFLNTQIPSGN